MNCLAAATFSIVKLDPNTSSSCSSRSSITVYVSSRSLSREYQFSLSRDSLWSSFLLQRRTSRWWKRTSENLFRSSFHLLLNRHSHATCSGRTFHSDSCWRGEDRLTGSGELTEFRSRRSELVDFFINNFHDGCHRMSGGSTRLQVGVWRTPRCCERV